MFDKTRKTIRLYKYAMLEIVATLATICRDRSYSMYYGKNEYRHLYRDHFDVLCNLEHEIRKDLELRNDNSIRHK